MTALRVLVVDDNPLFREAAATLLGLDDRVDVVGSAATSAEALGLLERTAVDVVLVDVNMPDRPGIDTAIDVETAHPGTTVLLCSTMSRDDLGLPPDRAASFIAKDELDADRLVARWRRRRP